MVERGYLAIRVALRCHRKTGEPLPFASREDGYVHEKWAIFKDEHGNRLLAEGSLNESKTALVLNAENLSVHCAWEGPKEAQRLDEAEQVFEAIWGGPRAGTAGAGAARGGQAAPHPDCPDPAAPKGGGWLQRGTCGGGEANDPGVAAVRYPARCAQDAERLLRRHGDGTGRTLAPSGRGGAPPDRVLPYSFLLCDEVGLGKTIEAGLALRSLILAGIARRVLIAPPASLALQWQNELQQKFFLRFARALNGAQPRHAYIHPVSEQRPADSVFAPNYVIVSTGLVRRKDRQRELGAYPWDIALVDEAHYARRSNSTAGVSVQPKYGDLYRALSETLRPQSRSLWLATATPMQLDPQVYDLFRLTRRVGPFQEDPSLTQAYYDIQGRIQRGERVFDDELAFLRQVLHSIRRHDPQLGEFIRETVLTPANRSQYDL
jgi:hypothetical protein